VSERVTRSRELVAQRRPAAVVARVAGISRQAIYRRPTGGRAGSQRLMREHRLLQPGRSEGRCRRPRYFQITRPDDLWHLDMTSVWVAEHGWTDSNAAIDCCTRQIVDWSLDVRCRAPEAIAVINRAVDERGIAPGQLRLTRTLRQARFLVQPPANCATRRSLRSKRAFGFEYRA
jgi:putative transposase